jgi:hypothetical protein
LVQKEYKPALEYTGIRSRKYIYNMDEIGCCITCSAGKRVVVLIRIKEMYVRVPENRLFLTVIESISVNGKSILSLVIVPSKNIIVFWFYKNITGEEIVVVLLLGYTNKEICLTWLDYFIKHNNYKLD